MTKEEMEEVSEMNSCKEGCAFCLSKCPECGSVNIGVKYRRYYKIDEYKMQMASEYSDAHVYCYDCNPEIEEEDPFEFEAEWEAQSEDDKAMLKSVSSPELAKQLNRHFDNDKKYHLPKNIKEFTQRESIEYFVDSYTYKNDTPNKIDLGKEGEPYCLNEANFEIFDAYIPYELSGLIGPENVNLSCEDDKEKPGYHFVINTTHYSVEVEIIRP
jgi:hypothetical protein